MSDFSPPPLEIPPASAVTESGLSPNIAAAAAEFFSLIGGLAFYFIEKNNAFVRFHALQSAYLGAAGVVFGSCIGIVTLIPFIGWLIGLILVFLLPLVSVIFAVLWIIATFQALNGKEWEIPWLGKLAHRHLAEGKFFFVKSPAL